VATNGYFSTISDLMATRCIIGKIPVSL
jgi:hypothetical protein